MRVVLVFVDGVGIGSSDPRVNPLVASKLPRLQSLCGGTIFRKKHSSASTPQATLTPLNATLGVPGLPQSGTGQAAIFAGVNGPKIFGKHFGPYPPSVLRPALKESNIFHQLLERNRRVVFANAFPKRFFEYIESGARRLSVTTMSCTMAGVRILTAADLALNRGISPDFFRTEWPRLGHPEIRPVTPGDAGLHLWNIAREHDFTLFEYWHTDKAGHTQSHEQSVKVLEALDEFLEGFFSVYDPATTTFILVSDHGNIEDLSTKSHTRNRVPCIVAGREHSHISQRLGNLTHIVPAILHLLQP